MAAGGSATLRYATAAAGSRHRWRSVVKHRTLFLVGRTRVHLDRVQGLGDFLELEVVLDDGEPMERGVRKAHELMTSLGVDPGRLIEDAYVDMQARQIKPRGEKSD